MSACAALNCGLALGKEWGAAGLDAEARKAISSQTAESVRQGHAKPADA